MKTITLKNGAFTAFLFMAALFFSSASFANEKPTSSMTSYRSNSVAEFVEGNYQVKVVTLPNVTGYGYEIYVEGKFLVTQLSKPYFDKPSLFSSLDNAKIIAKYHAANLNTKDPGNLTKHDCQYQLISGFISYSVYEP